MNRRDLIKAITSVGVAAVNWESIRKVADELLAREAKTGEHVKVMTPEQWLRFHKKRWPPRYD